MLCLEPQSLHQTWTGREALTSPSTSIHTHNYHASLLMLNETWISILVQPLDQTIIPHLDSTALSQSTKSWWILNPSHNLKTRVGRYSSNTYVLNNPLYLSIVIDFHQLEFQYYYKLDDYWCYTHDQTHSTLPRNHEEPLHILHSNMTCLPYGALEFLLIPLKIRLAAGLLCGILNLFLNMAHNMQNNIRRFSRPSWRKINF